MVRSPAFVRGSTHAHWFAYCVLRFLPYGLTFHHTYRSRTHFAVASRGSYVFTVCHACAPPYVHALRLLRFTFARILRCVYRCRLHGYVRCGYCTVGLLPFYALHTTTSCVPAVVTTLPPGLRFWILHLLVPAACSSSFGFVTDLVGYVYAFPHTTPALTAVTRLTHTRLYYTRSTCVLHVRFLHLRSRLPHTRSLRFGSAL